MAKDNDNDKPADAAPAPRRSAGDGEVRTESSLSTTERIEGVDNSLVTVNPGDDNSPLNNDGFVGVDPIYQNYANDTEMPLEGDDESPNSKSSK